MGVPASTQIPPTKGDCPAVQSESLKKTQKMGKADDVVSTIISDSLIAFRKKFHFPNDMVMKVPIKYDCAHSPPPGFVTVYEFNLRAGLRFPPSLELIDVLTIYGVSLAQLSYRAMSMIMGLVVLFRDRRVVLSSECLSWMGHLTSDTQGRISFRSTWLDIHTRDPSKEDLLKILKLPDIDALHYEVRYLSIYIDEEYLFKIFIKDQIQKARNHIYDVEVKALEVDCMEEGFIRGFMKGARAVQRKTGVEIEGLTLSQASSDPSSDSGGEELESEL
ncbi:hypothetical protein IEQ34_021874 [Dendrobium chrysotoxum]|uniref:Uncharacterized protein n=1 Tax=Dendrobium chrysotoxum TaxID=161865 RepID=A0AAV7FW48_DENCH|nr:hypothetical protein IEQ34_021874 [Dendrobium chrysotoxum]